MTATGTSGRSRRNAAGASTKRRNTSGSGDARSDGGVSAKAAGTDEDAPPQTTGERLRAARKAQGHSLATVSRATNISTSFLSLVETGRSDITLGRLMRLVSFYNIHISDLLPKPTPEHPGVVRAANQTLLHRSSSEGIAIYLLAPDMDRKLMPILVVVEPGGHTYEPTSYEGEEFIHVTEGVLSVLLGDDELLLHPGDTVYYDSSVPHSISNPGQSACRFFATVTPPHF